ncbi:MAG: hypothetical protein EXR47_08245 [Dehalococcoidia bacterium]|nr:hypothetical protein [Dehalococcoidia bacterium]
MLEELARMFQEATQSAAGLQDREQRMVALLNRESGPLDVDEASASRQAWATPDYVFALNIPCYHQGAVLLPEHKEALARTLGLTPMRAYSLLLKTAQERGAAPQRLAASLVWALDRDGSGARG